MPNRYVPVIPIPPTLPGVTFRSAISKALNDGVKPEKVSLKNINKKTLFIPPVIMAKVEELVEKHQADGLTFDDVFASLMIAGLKILQGKQAAFSMQVETSSPPPFSTQSQEQITFFKNIATSLDNGRLCLAEASTGIGKSRAMVAAAILQARKKKRVVMTAPTLKVLGQLWVEYENLKDEGIAQGVTAGFFPGITEFVSEERLREWIAEDASIDIGVRSWILEGGPVLMESPLIRAMRESGARLAFLADDLRQLAKDVPVNDFLLRSEEKELHQSLLAVRQAAIESDILFCTHAMLARAHQRQWAAFPAPDVLIVDEAHQLEQNFAKIHSESLSMTSLRFRLKQAAKATGASNGSSIVKALKIIESSRTRLSDVAAFSERRISLGPHMEDFDEIKEMLEEIGQALTPKPLSVVRDIGNDRSVIKEAINVVMGKKWSAFVEFSPDLRFPSIVIGRESIGDVLGNLWKSVGSAAVCSATLYISDEFGNNRADYMLSLLAMPKGRTDTPPPVIASWITAIPKLHLPSKELAEKLSRPLDKVRSEESETHWLINVADQCRKIVEESRGGTLILTASFAQVEALTKHIPFPTRIVAQRRNEKFSVAEEKFRALHTEGARPILIATGVAWTGIDLTDKSVAPEHDTLLSDLIIACFPIGLNKTTSAMSRFEKTGVDSIIKDALLIIKQGLGRLVRHPNAPEKNLWVLDGRLWTEWPKFERFQKIARRMFDRTNYRKQQVIR